MLAEKLLPVVKSTTATDPYFYDVTLLLNGDGTNGAQNNTFLDSSSNAFTITRNGDTTQGSFSPFASPNASWSNYFNGSSDYLTAPDNAVFEFGTGDFILEGWFYPTTSGTVRVLCSHFSGSSGWSWELTTGDLLTFWSGNGTTTGYKVTSTAKVTTNQWNYCVVSRSGTSLNTFINGVSGTSVTDSTNIADNSATVAVSATPSGTALFAGYVSNLRIIKGSAITSSTVPTAPLTAISGTSLLTCQSNRFIDNSSNAFAITVNGTPSVQAFSPFNPTAAYSTTINGGSGYFDGSGDYLTAPGSASSSLGTNNFTIECWVYLTNSFGSYYYIGAQDGASNAASNFDLIINGNANGDFRFEAYSGGSQIVNIIGGSGYWTPYQWTHVAVTRSGSNFTLWVNGVSRGTATSASSINSNTTSVAVGSSATAANYFKGYISGFRIVNGTAVYTTTFTPPTSPPTAVSNTSLLLNMTNAGIPDYSTKNDLQTVGNVQVSTSVKKYGTGSIAFDGTGDYLTTLTNPALNLGSSSIWTIEFWGYIGTTLGTFCPISMVQDTTNRWDIEIGASSTNLLFNNTTATSFTNPATITSNTWFHMAFVRDGTTVKMYLNGVASSTTSSSNLSSVSTSTLTYIGRNNFAGYNFDWNGYIDDMRITRGYARYTTNFTPPTAALPLY